MRSGSQRRAVHQQSLLLAMGILRLFGYLLLQHLGMSTGLWSVRGLEYYDYFCDHDNDDN